MLGAVTSFPVKTTVQFATAGLLGVITTDTVPLCDEDTAVPAVGFCVKVKEPQPGSAAKPVTKSGTTKAQEPLRFTLRLAGQVNVGVHTMHAYWVLLQFPKVLVLLPNTQVVSPVRWIEPLEDGLEELSVTPMLVEVRPVAGPELATKLPP